MSELNRQGYARNGFNLNADTTEVQGLKGHTLSVYETEIGRQLDTLITGNSPGRILLAPSGKELDLRW